MAWQYGGTLALMPAVTADYYGPKNLGLNYGLVFLGWGVAFFVPLLAGYIRKVTDSWDGAFYLSAGLLVTGVLISRVIRKPS
jgi:OFA family oxalate/formate antiporter-like MFS transporter